MGSISFQVASADPAFGASPKTKTYTVPDADVNRLVAWARAELRQNGDTGELTVAQALVRWADVIMAMTKERVRNYERSAASVADFTAT